MDDFLVLVKLDKGYTIPVIIKNVADEVSAMIKVLEKFNKDDRDDLLEIVGTNVIKLMNDIIVINE